MKIGREINVKNVTEFYKSVKNEVVSNDEIILDFSDTVRIDSAAAQVIIAAIKKSAELNKNISLTGVSPEMGALFKLVNL